MIPHPTELDDAYGVTAWEPFTRVTFISPTSGGGETQVVAGVVEGTFTASDTEWPRHTLDMTVPAGVTAADSARPVTSKGGRVLVEAGARIGGQEYAFQVHELDVVEVGLVRPDGTFTVKAVSPEARVNENRPAYPQDPPGGQSSVGVASLVSEALAVSGMGFYPYTSTLTTDDNFSVGDFIISDDVWPVIEDVMDGTGGEAYFRWDRRLILRDVPTLGSPVLTLKVGAGGTITGYRDLERWAYNAVYVRYTDASDNVDVGIWQDLNPSSPSYWDGPYGHHTRIIDRSCVTLPSLTRLNRMASSVAKRSAAPFYRLEVECVPVPWLEPGDTVSVQLSEDASPVDRLVSGVRWPLSQREPMTVITQDSDL